MPIKVRDLIRRLQQAGFTLDRQKGSHRHFKKAGHPNIVTVPGHNNDTLPIGLEQAILKSAGLREDS